MSIAVNVQVNETLTPTLFSLRDTLDHRGDLAMRKHVALRLEGLLRTHIIKAAKTRHKTAFRLGATPTNYLTSKAETVESFVNGVGKYGTIRLTVYGDIFARVYSPVLVKPKKKKALAIPAIKGAYGKRPGAIGGLRLVIFLDKKKAALAKVTGDNGDPSKPLFLRKGNAHVIKPMLSEHLGSKTIRIRRRKDPKSPNRKVEIWFWLSRGVLLPKDAGLLPTDAEFTAAAEAGAVDFLEAQIAKQLGNGFAPPPR